MTCEICEMKWNSCRSLHVLYEKLPYDIAERHVLLMDPILASGNTCAAAIEVPLTRLPPVTPGFIGFTALFSW